MKILEAKLRATRVRLKSLPGECLALVITSQAEEKWARWCGKVAALEGQGGLRSQ